MFNLLGVRSRQGSDVRLKGGGFYGMRVVALWNEERASAISSEMGLRKMSGNVQIDQEVQKGVKWGFLAR